MALICLTLVTVMACGADSTSSPDALRPEALELIGVAGNPLPYLVSRSLGGSTWIRSASLKSIEPARAVDPRLLQDRSGSGSSSGASRDSAALTARMADVRVFEERDLGNKVINLRTDSSGVIVERRGDLLFITREHPDPARTVVDTGRFSAGYMVVNIREWERLSGSIARVNVQFSYVVKPQ